MAHCLSFLHCVAIHNILGAISLHHKAVLPPQSPIYKIVQNCTNANISMLIITYKIRKNTFQWCVTDSIIHFVPKGGRIPPEPHLSYESLTHEIKFLSHPNFLLNCINYITIHQFLCYCEVYYHIVYHVSVLGRVLSIFYIGRHLRSLIKLPVYIGEVFEKVSYCARCLSTW